MLYPKDQQNNKSYQIEEDSTRLLVANPGERSIKEEIITLEDVDVLLDFKDLTEIINKTLKKAYSFEKVENAKEGNMPDDTGPINDPVIQNITHTPPENKEKAENPVVAKQNEIDALLDFEDLTNLINTTLKKAHSSETAAEVTVGNISEAMRPVKDLNDQISSGSCTESPKMEKQVEKAELKKESISNVISLEKPSTKDIDPDFLNDFLFEAKEHVENIEMNVLALETDPSNMELIHSLFRSFHTIKGLAGFVNQELIREIAHQTETQLDKCRKGEINIGKGFVDLILASSDYLKRICENLNLTGDEDFINSIAVHLKKMQKTADNFSATNLLNEEISKRQTIKGDKIGEILIGKGLDPNIVEELLKKQKEYPGLKLGQIAVKEKKIEAQEIIQSLRIQERASTSVSNRGNLSYTRVSTPKIDNLVDLVGEVVIIQSQIEQEAVIQFGANHRLVNNLIRMEKIFKDIQNISLSLRMVSLKSTFQKIIRIGRDTIAELKKNVRLEILGEATEIDRGIAERILDPLLHLVKNSIAHGIEEEAERIVSGKPAQGKVKIEAYSKRGNVYIEVADDGKGINLERIYQAAVIKKLLEPTKTYTDEEIINLVFLPGFSTSENVDSVSGRGVGLDVVKTEISKLGGKVELNNQMGIGCVFTLKIPINLAVINGTIIDIMDSRYIIPTLNIKQIIKPEAEHWVSISGNKTMIRIKDDIIPLIPIAKIFGLPLGKKDEPAELIIILELEKVLKALPVQRIVDRREIVVKPLGSEFGCLDYAAGASILGDGRVSLILDIENLFRYGETV